MAIIKIGNPAIDLDAAEIPNLDTAKITTGTLADARVPDLNASKITAGTIATARLGTGTADATTFLRGDNTFAAPPAGGIENISTFRMTTNFTMTTGAQITANWSKQGATLGTAISESSGTFSFPQTGLYRVEANFNLMRVQGDSDYIELNIKGTTDNSSYAELLSQWTHIGDVANQHSCIYGAIIFDVTNTTNDKIRLHYESESATNIRLIGSSDREGTYIRFIRLGAT